MTDLLSFIFVGLLSFYFIFIRNIRKGITKLGYFKTQSQIDEFISIIITFRNERENILQNLKSIESQNYPDEMYEVIYVNDFSTDDSLEIVKEGITKENIKIYSMSESKIERAHKKQAIEFAISKAKGDIILFTDADCIIPSDWIGTMVSGFEDDTAMISGPVAFSDSDSLFGKLQQLEFAGLILTGAGLIGNKTPMIASSANLAFRKSVFKKVGGYKDMMNLSSGDDELLMQKIAYNTEYEVKFCFSKDALVVTDPNGSISEFNQQRKRWASKSLFYEKKEIVLQLISIFLFYIWILVLPFLGLFLDPKYWIQFGVAMFVKFIIEYAVLEKGIGLLLEKVNLRIFFLAQLLHIPYIVYSSIFGLFGNFKWKGRELKR